MRHKFHAPISISYIQKLIKLLCVILFICINNFANSQSYPLPSPGSKWNVMISSFGGYQCTLKYIYVKDTVMCGYTYNVISNQNQSACSWSSPLLIRNDNNMIYGRIGSCLSNEI